MNETACERSPAIIAGFEETPTMIQVQLWKHDVPLRQETVEDTAAAERAIDRMINDVLHGRHGSGRYKIYADYVDRHGLFVGAFQSPPWFTYPVTKGTAAV